MDAIALVIPALYAAALTMAAASDFTRAQWAKNLEFDSPALPRLLHSVSLPTICLVAALLMRWTLPVKHLLLPALALAAGLSLVRAVRESRRHGLIRAAHRR
jgi:hypothetical protein